MPWVSKLSKSRNRIPASHFRGWYKNTHAPTFNNYARLCKEGKFGLANVNANVAGLMYN